VSVAAAMASLAFDPPGDGPGRERGLTGGAQTTLLEPEEDVLDEAADQPWHLVRMKEHPSEPMTVDDALFHMELLGHDFYLFNDKESGQPSVVYRRKAYDYGLISLAR
jgi:hypothetical protein